MNDEKNIQRKCRQRQELELAEHWKLLMSVVALLPGGAFVYGSGALWLHYRHAFAERATPPAGWAPADIDVLYPVFTSQLRWLEQIQNAAKLLCAICKGLLKRNQNGKLLRVCILEPSHVFPPDASRMHFKVQVVSNKTRSVLLDINLQPSHLALPAVKLDRIGNVKVSNLEQIMSSLQVMRSNGRPNTLPDKKLKESLDEIKLNFVSNLMLL